MEIWETGSNKPPLPWVEKAYCAASKMTSTRSTSNRDIELLLRRGNYLPPLIKGDTGGFKSVLNYKSRIPTINHSLLFRFMALYRTMKGWYRDARLF